MRQAVVCLCLIVAVACGGDSSPTAPTPAPTPTPTPTPTPPPAPTPTPTPPPAPTPTPTPPPAPTPTPTPPPAPTPPTADIYQPLAGLRVSPGRVQFLFFSAGQCINLSDTSVNGVVYTTHTSKWQRRDSSTNPWTDISGTERDGLCSYSPSDPGEYRLVGEVTIDGTRGKYSSENTITR